MRFFSMATAMVLVAVFATAPAVAQHEHGSAGEHEMWMWPLGGGWNLMGMGMLVPLGTLGAPGEADSPLNRNGFFVVHPVGMFNLESEGSQWAIRFTPNFEGLTIPRGELAFGGWGEGFIDKRHPHTLLHELMVSYNAWDFAGGALSISAGRGFAPFGTDDPMARPVSKYPTNHHLSQILERWTLNAVFLRQGWSIEAGLFGGDEPENPWDLSNISSFGNSFSGRIARRFGAGFGPMAEWEVSASGAMVRESHGPRTESTVLANVAGRHAGRYGFGNLYALIEASQSWPDDHHGYWALLGETELQTGPHRPYYRIEYSTRPEYEREGPPGTHEFFRYDHDDHAIGATRWLINSVGYGFTLTDLPWSIRPFAEVQHHSVWHERGPASLEPEQLFGTASFWALSAGVRIFLGGDRMRMGGYGVLDPMTVSHRMPHETPHDMHPGHPPHDGMHDAAMDPHDMHRAMEFFVRLLDDPEVERRLHADHARHQLWEDPAVQRHIETMRASVRTGVMADHETMDREGMHRAMELFVRLLDDPQVDARIHANPELHRLWADPAVQRHIRMMREMHGEPTEPEPHHDH